MSKNIYVKNLFLLFIPFSISHQIRCQEMNEKNIDTNTRMYSASSGIIFTTDFEGDMLDAYNVNLNYEINKHSFSLGPMVVINRWESNSLNKPIIGINGSYHYYLNADRKLQFFAHYSLNYFQYKRIIFYHPEPVKGKNKLFTNTLGYGFKLRPFKKNDFSLTHTVGFTVFAGKEDYWNNNLNTVVPYKSYGYGLTFTLSINYIIKRI